MGSLWNPAARILLTVAAARVGFALANTQRNTMDMSQLGRGTLPKEVDPWSTRFVHRWLEWNTWKMRPWDWNINPTWISWIYGFYVGKYASPMGADGIIFGVLGLFLGGRLVLVSFVKYVCLCACFCLGGHFRSFWWFPCSFLQGENPGTWLVLHASTGSTQRWWHRASFGNGVAGG